LSICMDGPLINRHGVFEPPLILIPATTIMPVRTKVYSRISQNRRQMPVSSLACIRYYYECTYGSGG
jgi:hypothetical protein